MAEATTLDFALYYASRGMEVFPVDEQKHPVVKWSEEATTDKEKINLWWGSKFRNSGIGIATGKRSGIIVLDIDNGKGGSESLMALLVEYGQLPDTPETITGGGGRHIIFAYPGVEIRNSASKLGPGLDIRGDGGYIVAPPSMHHSGRRYVWEPSAKLSQIALASMPQWLINLTREHEQTELPQIADKVPDKIISGARNHTLTSLAGTMRRRGMSEEAIHQALMAENRRRCDPPLPDSEVKQIANSVGRYKPSAPAYSGNPETIKPREPMDAFMVGTTFMEMLDHLDGISIDTGLRKLDESIGGFERKTITVIAARPSMGKTTFAWQCARQMAQAGSRIIFFSLEMSATSLWAKSVCGTLGIRWRNVRGGNVTENEMTKIYDETGRQMNLYGESLLIDDGVNTTDTIYSVVERMRPDVVFVDHLRLMADPGDREDKRLGTITQKLKEIAKEFNCAMVVLAQLNRNLENRESKRPTLADLRDSGQIEENADLVLMLHNEEYFTNEESATPKMEILVRKFREDVLKQRITVAFDKPHQTFRDMIDYDLRNMPDGYND